MDESTSWGYYHVREPPSYEASSYETTPHEMATFSSAYSRDSSYRASAADSDAPLLGARAGQVYDASSRRWAFLGILWSLLWALILCAAGVLVWFKAAPSQDPSSSWVQDEDYYPDNSQGILILWNLPVPEWIPKLALNVLVTLCNVATGNVHATCLKWALIEAGRPGFNANIRLFTAIGGLFGMNGYLANFLHAACLIISQASVSVVILPGPKEGQILVPAMPILVIGGSLLIQSLIVLLAFFRVPVRSWSNSPLDVAIAAKVTNQIGRVEGRCMRPAAAQRERTPGPINPSKKQPSAWDTHRQVKYIVSAFCWIVHGF
jgi:hypothetical protein